MRLAAPFGACALAALAWGCKGVTADANAPVAIEFVTPQAPPVQLEELDTVVIGVRVRNQSGDTIPNSPIRLVSLAPDTVGVDSALRFGLVGLHSGAGRVVAISGTLQSDPLQVQVAAAADSMVVMGTGVDTVIAGDSVSAPLVAALLDWHSTAGDTATLGARPVTFAIVAPVFDSLAAATVTLNNDSLTATVLTPASVTVQSRATFPRPDSVVVEASAKRANGTAVPGSPVRFVVHFQ